MASSSRRIHYTTHDTLVLNRIITMYIYIHVYCLGVYGVADTAARDCFVAGRARRVHYTTHDILLLNRITALPWSVFVVISRFRGGEIRFDLYKIVFCF